MVQDANRDDAPKAKPRDTSNAEVAMSFDRAAKSVTSVRTILGFLGLCIGAAVAVVLGYLELKAKPSQIEVDAKVEQRISPLEERVAPMEETIGAMKRDIGRIEDIQDVNFDQRDYDMKVLRHIAGRKKGPMPDEPKALTDKKNALMRGKN